jgi:hypothetical protein
MDVSGNPGNSGKKKWFSGFQDDAKIQPISGKSAEPGKSDVFGGKFPKIPNPDSEIPENFGKKVPKRRFWKIQPSFAERFKTHILRAKIKKKSENLGTLRTGFPKCTKFSPKNRQKGHNLESRKTRFRKR